MNGDFPIKLLRQYVLSMFSPAKSRKRASELIGDVKSHSLPDILKHIQNKYGFGGLIKADAVLFGWALLLTALIDLFADRLPMVQKGLGAVVCFLMCHMADEEISRAFLISAFLLTTCIADGSWFLTTLFLILFEHIGVVEKLQ